MDSRLVDPNLKMIMEKDGFAVVPGCLNDQAIGRLSEHFTETQDSQRNILSVPIVRQLAESAPVREIAEAVLGPKYFAVRGIFFNKTEKSNWKVAWHQDVTIAVRKRAEVLGFGPWSLKAGILHVQPPSEILSDMLAVRLHLDENGPDNGPLRVIPGSHATGRLTAEAVNRWQSKEPVTCTVPKGGALLMRPLLLHASSTCSAPKPRRVIHLEFASEDLPKGLEWYERI